MNTEQIMPLVEAYAAVSAMTLAEPSLKRLSDAATAKAALQNAIKALSELSGNSEQLHELEALKTKLHEVSLDWQVMVQERDSAVKAAKYAEHIDATPENQRETMLYDALKERDALSKLADKWNLECDEMREDNKRLAAERDLAQADALEQARLCGMGGEREADLLGKVARLERERDELKAELEDERTRGLQLLADAKEWQQQFVGAQAEVRELQEANAQLHAIGAKMYAELAAIKAQQPLSVLQIERIYDEVPEFQPDGSWWIVALARAIEQAHGIKGASL